jgi:hypothetical protein
MTIVRSLALLVICGSFYVSFLAKIKGRFMMQSARSRGLPQGLLRLWGFELSAGRQELSDKFHDNGPTALSAK